MPAAAELTERRPDALRGLAADRRRQLLRRLDQRRQALLLASLFLIVVGSRAAVINHAGNPTPYLDEWDGGAANLLRPFLQNTLTVGDLFRAHNEHVIFFTRVLTLGIFTLSGYWDVILQMIVNAILDAATVVAASYALSRPLRGGWAMAAMVVSALINALPLSCDNILLGFETHFYLLVAFSLASLWFMADSGAWSLRWAAGFLFALASFLCMASGALTLAAATGLHLLQAGCGRRAGAREWLGIAASAGATVLLAGLIPHAPSSDAYRAQSLTQFLSAVFELMSWPAPLGLGWLMALPSALFCLRTLADRPPLRDPRWFNVAAFGWILTQFAAFAAGRAVTPIQNRYLDTLLMGVAVNITSAFWLVGSGAASGRRQFWRSAALALWLVVVAASFVHTTRALPGWVETRRGAAEVQERNLRNYLARGDPSFLGGVPMADIPYPDSTRLRELLDTPEIRAALPPDLLSRDPQSNWVEWFKRTFLGGAFGWLAAGVFLLLTVLARAAWAPAAQGPQA